jgi:hypothetical protein
VVRDSPLVQRTSEWQLVFHRLFTPRANTIFSRVIVISPFKHWTLRHQETALEKRVQLAVNSVNDDPQHQVRLVWRLLRFSLPDVFAEKGSRDSQLDAVVAKLRDGIQSTPRRPLARTIPRVRHDEEGTRLPLIFITHSVGHWVMEGALAKVATPGFDRRLVGVIVLDASPTGVADADFLNRLSRAMNIPIGAANRVEFLVDKFLGIADTRRQSVVLGEPTGNKALKSQHLSGWQWVTKTFAVWVPYDADVRPTNVSFQNPPQLPVDTLLG